MTRHGLIVFLSILLLTQSGRADSIIGLPKPREAGRPGAVLLHGGGVLTNQAFDRFVALAGGSKARIVLVPSAGYGPTGYASPEEFNSRLRSRFASWVHLPSDREAASVEFLYTDDPKDADDNAFVRPLTKATGVWFCGGDQGRLNYRFVGRFPQQTKFQAALREVLERGGVVGGTSAGMAALPEVITLSQASSRAVGPLSARAAHGFGLFNGAIVEQHFDGRNGRLERFTGLLRDSERLDKLAGRNGAGSKMLGLAVEEATGLVVQGDQLEVIGKGEAHVFIKAPGGETITWHALNTGTRADLQRDQRGHVSLLRHDSR